MEEVTTSKITIDHDEIQEWMEKHDGGPALNDSDNGRGLLAVNFGEVKEFEPLSWDEFFDQFDANNLAFQFNATDTDTDVEGDEFAYSFIDRNLIPSDDSTDENDESGAPASDIPRENVDPSASPQDTDPDNMGLEEHNDDDEAVEELNEVDEHSGM